MNQYVKTYGEPGSRKVRTHIGHPSMDMTLCGVDASGDDLVHDAEPEYLPRGKKHRVTCEDCLQIIEVVKDHVSSAKDQVELPPNGGSESKKDAPGG